MNNGVFLHIEDKFELYQTASAATNYLKKILPIYDKAKNIKALEDLTDGNKINEARDRAKIKRKSENHIDNPEQDPDNAEKNYNPYTNMDILLDAIDKFSYLS